MEEDEALAKAIAASLEDQKGPGEASAASSTPPALSLEEKEALAKQKLEEIKRNKEEEERKLDRERERDRVRFGKEMVAQKRVLEDQERQRLADFRKREKEEQKRAKQAVLEQIARDKAERQSGAKKAEPAESSEAQRQAEAKRKQRENDSVFGVKPVTIQNNIRDLLVQIKKSYPEEKSAICFKTLNVYCKNLLRVPAEAKFRSINSANKAFVQRVACLEGGEGPQILGLVGFEMDPETRVYEMRDEKLSKLVVEAALKELNNAMTNPFFGSL
ncbi:PUB domain-containing protein [Chloropicon primus]|uniref:PUB domain-containing protein n=1 Tax=Chloropicon primus TaxID=1764295 RepID=A0A5B8MBM4_9CHLO|nr:hypothetical protein A3770_01p00190 [Chloropicon primus]UPQ96721.1 PUB domain-containing protein [Chloropicon primus]|eukprot:QDZ17501.1 hypothetical protein A3770_01p00190 [Chloropicon primus]